MLCTQESNTIIENGFEWLCLYAMHTSSHALDRVIKELTPLKERWVNSLRYVPAHISTPPELEARQRTNSVRQPHQKLLRPKSLVIPSA